MFSFVFNLMVEIKKLHGLHKIEIINYTFHLPVYIALVSISFVIGEMIYSSLPINKRTMKKSTPMPV